MKKKLALLLAAVMLLSLTLAGCGNGKTPNEPGANSDPGTGDDASDPGTSDPGTSDPGTSGGDTITYWNIATDEPDTTVFSYAVDKYNSENSAESGYTIEQVSTVNDQYKSKLAVAMGAGQCPDVYVHCM